MAYVTYKRPVYVSILCIIGFIFPVLFGMGMLFSPETKRMGDFFPALFGLLVALRFISYVGLWYMKRWGVDLLMATFTLSLVKDILLDDVSVISVVWHLIVIGVMAFQYKKMDRNL